MLPRTAPPTDDAPTCEHCGDPFPDEDLLALHRGREHADRLDEAERDAYGAALDDETRRLRLFRLQAVGALVVLYFGFLFAYAVVT